MSLKLPQSLLKSSLKFEFYWSSVFPINKRFYALKELSDENGDGYTSTEESDVVDRCVSRMPPKFHNQYHGVAPEAPYKDLRIKQQRFARYGRASGEDPSVMWPSRAAIRQAAMEDSEEEGLSLSQRIEQAQAEKQKEVEETMARRRLVEHNMSQMPKWIAEYREKQAQAEREARQRASKKESLLEEARDYLGYKVKGNDPKFQQMVEEKEERERQEAKKRKKEEKTKKLAARMSDEMAKQAKSDTKPTAAS